MSKLIKSFCIIVPVILFGSYYKYYYSTEKRIQDPINVRQTIIGSETANRLPTERNEGYIPGYLNGSFPITYSQHFTNGCFGEMPIEDWSQNMYLISIDIHSQLGSNQIILILVHDFIYYSFLCIYIFLMCCQ